MDRRRRLSEIIFAHRNGGGEVVDIFVEGGGDKLLLDKFLSERAKKRCAVYSMDTIDFSGTNFSALGLPSPSARSEVIALRRAFSSAGTPMDSKFFLVDRDQEDLVATPYLEGVNTTDSGALPVHLFDNRVEELVCAMLLRGKVSVDTLKRSVLSICKSMYAVRAASRILDVSAKIKSPKDFLELDSDGIYSIDIKPYTERCLHAGGGFDRRQEMHEAIPQIMSRMLSLGLPGFSFMNDHDLWVVLRDLFSKFGDSSNKSADDIEGAILMTFDAGRLCEHGLFKKLVELVEA